MNLRGEKLFQALFSDHNGMKPDINHRKRKEKRQVITWKLNNRILKKTPSQHEIKEEVKKNTLRQMTMKTQSQKIYGM